MFIHVYERDPLRARLTSDVDAAVLREHLPKVIEAARRIGWVRMKLTSYRLKDRVHIQDLDGFGLISAEIEAQLPEVLKHRLTEIRHSE